MGGVRRKVAFLVMALPHSDALFVQAFPRECTETFWEGHVRVFEFFGLVPRRIAYDNTKVAVAQILGPRARRLTRGFQQLVSHYLFGIAPPCRGAPGFEPRTRWPRGSPCAKPQVFVKGKPGGRRHLPRRPSCGSGGESARRGAWLRVS